MTRMRHIQFSYVSVMDGVHVRLTVSRFSCSLTCSYWRTNQPDNGDGDPKWGEEDCAHMRTGTKTVENWNDRSCDASLKWTCEKNADV